MELSEGLKASERMSKAIASQSTKIRKGPISVTASFGVAIVSPGLRDFDKALTEAMCAKHGRLKYGR